MRPSMTSSTPQWTCGCLRRWWMAVNSQKSSTQTTKMWSICPDTSCPPMWWDLRAAFDDQITRCIFSVWGVISMFSHNPSPHQRAVPDLAESVKGADILIFVVPHQFIIRVCDTIKEHIKKDAVGMSLIKVTFYLYHTLQMWFPHFSFHTDNRWKTPSNKTCTWCKITEFNENVQKWAIITNRMWRNTCVGVSSSTSVEVSMLTSWPWPCNTTLCL